MRSSGRDLPSIRHLPGSARKEFESGPAVRQAHQLAGASLHTTDPSSQNVCVRWSVGVMIPPNADRATGRPAIAHPTSAHRATSRWDLNGGRTEWVGRAPILLVSPTPPHRLGEERLSHGSFD